MSLVRKRTAFALAIALGAAASGVSLSAAELPRPQGPILLRVSGDITVTNAGDEAHFDRDMLMALGPDSVTTSTIWTEGDQTFSGPSLAALLAAVGAEGKTITATALNDYAVQIPVDDAQQGFALLAMDRNGEPMSVRDKGPLWVVYPFDSDPKFQSEVYYSRSIWQLDRLAVMR